jgi:uncharacterized membrane protein HdeD (DUF308 family)
VTSAFEGESPDVARARRTLLIGGVASLIAGFVAIIVPAVASVTMSILLGWVLLGAGAFMVVEAFSAGGLGRAAARALIGIVTFAAGLYLLVAPLDGVFTLTVMLVIWFVAVGFARIVFGLMSLGTPGAGLTIASGAIALLLGILIGNNLPESSDWAIGLLVGIDLVIWGFNLLAARAAVGKVDEALRTPRPAM